MPPPSPFAEWLTACGSVVGDAGPRQVLAGAMGVAAGVRVTLVVLAVLIAGFLGALAVVLLALRRRDGARPVEAPARPPAAARRPRLGSSSRPAVTSVGAELAATLVASPAPALERMICPACRRDFDTSARVCPSDGRRLVPEGEAPPRRGGAVCPRCWRGFDVGIERCAFDGEELVVPSAWEVAPPRRHRLVSTGVVGRGCPQCGGRFDLALGTCPRDGAELVTIN